MRGKKREKQDDSDTKIDVKKHAQLLDSVLNLNKKPQLKKPSRTEPTLQISEFNLVKSVRGKKGAIRVSDLTKALKKGAKQVEISKKVKSSGRKAKTLPKPLEKPKAQRIRRTAAFENVKKQLGRWDAVVTSNRASNRLTFPLNTDTKLECSKNFNGFRLKTDLQKKLEELEPKVEVFNLEKESEYPLTMQEMLERRKEMAKMRAVQSYKEAKARRQSKIKSKKYHRIQRHEKVKKQIKEFEQLQKTNPEEALKKLEEIERVRAEERASLRHRNTGKWAKNLQVRAKYDKDSRQVLAQQLQVSRELTQKLKANNEGSESEEELTNNTVSAKSSENNPWTKPIKTTKEVETFLSGYRKFWESENKKTANQNNKLVLDKKMTVIPDHQNDITSVKESEVTEEIDTSEKAVSNNHTESESKLKTPPKASDQVPNVENKSKLVNKRKVKSSQELKTVQKAPDQIPNLEKKSKSKNKQNTDTRHTSKAASDVSSKLATKQINNEITNKRNKFIATTNWDVSSLDDDTEDEIDTIFDNFEDKIQKKVKAKSAKLKKELQKQKLTIKQQKNQLRKTKKVKSKKQKNKIDLSFPQAAKRPVIDEELVEVTNSTDKNKARLAILDSVLRDSSALDENTPSEETVTNNIDPSNIIKTKPVNLDTEIPDLLTLEDNEEDTDQRGTISEAFEDDDILEEFKKDKVGEIEGEKPQDINLALPGWGSWGGTGIKPSKRKNKRFIIKLPKTFKRRDENKGNLIINEKADAKIKPHLVSEVPFPFKTVKDFEASVRAPIGNTFVPETAFRKMIRPAVTTKLGTVIEPMTDDILLKKKK